jgi:quinol monooxygenase YgiN
MPIHMIAEYRVRPETVDACLEAIRRFVAAVADAEPGTRHYVAWQDERDPVHFVHHFVFEDEAAEQRHRESTAVQAFTGVVYPATVNGVHFTRYAEVASNHRHGPPA